MARTPPFQDGEAGSEPVWATILTRCLSSSCGSGVAVRPDLRELAQSDLEHSVWDGGAVGLNPAFPTIF